MNSVEIWENPGTQAWIAEVDGGRFAEETMAVGGKVSVEALEQLLDAFNQHDIDRIMEFFSDDATFDLPQGPQPWGTRFVGNDGPQGTGHSLRRYP